MDELLERGDVFEIDGPFGDVTMAEPPPETMLIIAAGTGAAQATSLIEAMVAEPARPKTTLWWSVSSPADLYQDTFFDDGAMASWLTYRGFVDDLKGNNQLLPYIRCQSISADDVVLAGPPGFVYAAFDALIAIGVREAAIRSDVFAYAPR